MKGDGRAWLGLVGASVLGGAVLTAGAASTTEAPLRVACALEQPVVHAGGRVALRAWADAAHVEALRYFWTVEAGRVSNTAHGAEVVWELAAVEQSPVPYTAKVRVLGPGGMAADCTVRLIIVPKPEGLGGGQPRPRYRGGREAGRVLLRERVAEAEGYGLYSYLLFGAAPDHKVQATYLEAIRAALRLVPHLEDLEKYFKRSELNALYLPVRVGPEGGPDTQAVTPEWILAQYDYARAKALMKTLPGTNRAGPYLVSSRRPLGQADTRPEHYLFQDLSAVPPQLVSAWVREFLNQTAQQDFSDADGAPSMVLKVRTIVTRVATASKEVEDAMKQLGFDIPTFVKARITWQ